MKADRHPVGLFLQFSEWCRCASDVLEADEVQRLSHKIRQAVQVASSPVSRFAFEQPVQVMTPPSPI